MKSRAKAADRSQIERKKIEKESSIGFRGQRNHFALLVRARVFVNPLKISGLPAEARTVVHELAVYFAGGEINERHKFLSFMSLGTYSIGSIRWPTNRLANASQ